MARDKGQVLLYSEAELSLIKAVFADNEPLLYALRNFFLQFKLSDTEVELIKKSITPEIIDILKKRIYPEMTGDEPFGQLSDMYQTLRDLKNDEELKPTLDATRKIIDFLTQQFEVLKALIKGEGVAGGLKLDDWKAFNYDPYETYTNTKARNFILGHIDGKISMIKNIAGEKVESTEEVKKRLTRDSSK